MNIEDPKLTLLQFNECINNHDVDRLNTFTRRESRNDLVLIFGHAFWSEEQPHDAAIWNATIAGDPVQEWHIYADSGANRSALHLAVLS